MPSIIFYLPLIAALILEGTGVRYGRDISFWIIIALPALLFFLIKAKFQIPEDLKIPYILFLVITSISTLFSGNIVLSVQYLIFYISLGFIFIFSFNNKKLITNSLIPVILILSFFFFFYSIVIDNFVARNAFIFPHSTYQLVSALFTSHSHLGDWLLLPLIICFYYLLSKNFQKSSIINHKSFIMILLLILFLPIFLFSYSRSGYISLIFAAGFMAIYFANKNLRSTKAPLGVLIVLFVSLVFLIVVTVTPQQASFVSKINSLLIQNNNLSVSKQPSGARNEYLRYALLSTKEKPLLGVGPGNYIEASKKYMDKPWLRSETSHNIFLDILSENGIAALILFAYVLYLVFKKTDRSVYFFMALALFIDFQTDYTYRIYSLIALFVVLLGLTYNGNTNLKGK